LKAKEGKIGKTGDAARDSACGKDFDDLLIPLGVNSAGNHVRREQAKESEMLHELLVALPPASCIAAHSLGAV
jgi:hypothetical protein